MNCGRLLGLVLTCFFGAMASLGCAAMRAPVNVRTCGALGDGKTKDTAAFQTALDKCAAAGGGEVVVPAGDYFLGSIAIKSNTTLRLEKDANITGTPDLKDYPIVKGRWEGRWVDAYRGLISAQDAKHIAVVGPGHITGSPQLGGRQMPRRPCVIETINCTDVHFADFFAQQQRMWTIHPTYCENVSAKNLTIRSNTGNGDGIDVDSCRHVKIEDCDIETGDDCVAIKSGRGMEGYRLARPTEDVLISHCTLGDSVFACVGIGSETSGGIRNIRIEHCTFTRANTFSIYIKSRPGRGAFIEDISAKDLTVQSAARGFLRINLLSSGIQDPEPVPGDEGIPSAKNYSFSDVKLEKCGALVDAESISPVKPLNGLAISKVSGECQKGIVLTNITNANLSNIAVTGFTGPLLSSSNVSGVGLDGAVSFQSKNAPPTTAASR